MLFPLSLYPHPPRKFLCHTESATEPKRKDCGEQWGGKNQSKFPTTLSAPMAFRHFLAQNCAHGETALRAAPHRRPGGTALPLTATGGGCGGVYF